MRYRVHVHPRAARERIVVHDDGSVSVWVSAPAVEGRANAALIALLAARLGLRAREVVLLKGERSRQKLVELPVDPATLRGRLSPA